MSSVARVPAWTITLMDETGNSALTRGSLAAGTSADAALAHVTALASAEQAITGCSVVRVSVSYRINLIPLGTPTIGARASDQGALIFHTNDADNLAVVSIAGISRDKLRNDGCFSGIQLDLTDADIIAVIDTISDGIWCDPFGADIAGIKAGYLREVF